MYKHLYSHFLNANRQTLHMAAHSHHFWPDISLAAHTQYWHDSAQLVDDKWSHIFGNKVPRVQKLIAKELGLHHPEQIVFAPNTHEFVMRLLSCLEEKPKKRILTTDSEFYSFDRQARRLEEDSSWVVERVPTEPLETFCERFAKAAQENSYDMIFVSQVFFNSGFAVNLDKLIPSLPAEPILVVDGYHGFMAIPTDLAAFQKRIFYLAGSYKYAQGGEGCCFLVVPKDCNLRPRYTGWFAELAGLSNISQNVAYPDSGLRFAGSTFDFTALYRLDSVMTLFEQEKMTTALRYRYIQDLQKHFLNLLSELNHTYLNLSSLVDIAPNQRGHFLTFELPSAETTIELVAELKGKGIWVDSRAQRIRFGFGLYLEKGDLDKFLTKALT